MKHYRLYRCVMSRSPLRESITNSLVLPVHGPPRRVQPLNKGMEPEVWEYEKAIQELENQRHKSKQQRQALKCDQDKEAAKQLTEAHCRISELGDPVDSQIIQEVANAHVTAASCSIQLSIAETMDEVTFVLDKASLPRPAALDSPPLASAKKAASSPKQKRK